MSTIAAAASTTEATPAPNPKGPRPKNGAVILRKGSAGQGKLVVDNGTGQDAYVTMVRDGAAVLAMYVHAGSKATATKIADGTYQIYTSTGSAWNEDLREFTADVSNSVFEDLFAYKTTATTAPGWEITLQKVEGGNAETSNVPTVPK